MKPNDRRGYVHESDTKRAQEHSSSCNQVEKSSLPAAVDFLFRSTEAVRESRRTRRDIFNIEVSALREWGQASGLILAALELNQFTPVSSGAEHEVMFDPEGQRAIKITRAGAFGHSVVGPGLSATPREYLLRWNFHNLLFGDNAGIFGLLCSEASVQCVVSQKWVTAHAQTPTPTDAEIDSFFRDLNFEKISTVEVPAFYSGALDLVILDAHPHNILRDEAENLVPIDLVVGTPAPWTREWLGLDETSARSSITP